MYSYKQVNQYRAMHLQNNGFCIFLFPVSHAASLEIQLVFIIGLNADLLPLTARGTFLSVHVVEVFLSYKPVSWNGLVSML